MADWHTRKFLGLGLLMSSFLIATPASASVKSFAVAGQSVHSSEFEVCDAAKTAIVQGKDDAELNFLIYDAGGNIVLFDTSDSTSARATITKIEQLECETFTLSIINLGDEETEVDFALLLMRGDEGTRGEGPDAPQSLNRFPRCPSTDPRCAML